MLFKETVTPELINVAAILCSTPALASFRIVGGTAIALQIGHRKSVDIDLFSNEKAGKKNMLRALADKFDVTDFYVGVDTISGEINGVRVELYDDWMIPFKNEPVVEEGLRLSSLEDLAGFKLNAITERREKKDYIDLYFLFEKLGAHTILKKFKEYNPLISQKSILFALSEVKTAEQNDSVMPDMHKQVSWTLIRKSMIQAAKDYLAIEENKG